MLNPIIESFAGSRTSSDQDSGLLGLTDALETALLIAVQGKSFTRELISAAATGDYSGTPTVQQATELWMVTPSGLKGVELVVDGHCYQVAVSYTGPASL